VISPKLYYTTDSFQFHLQLIKTHEKSTFIQKKSLVFY